MENNININNVEWTGTDFYHYTLMLSAEDNLEACLKLANRNGEKVLQDVLCEVDANFNFLVKRNLPILIQAGVSKDLLKVDFSHFKKTMEILKDFMTPDEMASLRFWPSAFATYEDFFVQYQICKAQLFEAA